MPSYKHDEFKLGQESLFTDILRFHFDTIAIDDWNEIDYIEVTGVVPSHPVCYAAFLEDSYGDGWNGGLLNIVNAAGDTVFTGGGAFLSGYVSTVEVCLDCGECYTGEMTGSSYNEEISWFLSGLVGGHAMSAVSTNTAMMCVACGSGGGDSVYSYGDSNDDDDNYDDNYDDYSGYMTPEDEVCINVCIMTHEVENPVGLDCSTTESVIGCIASCGGAVYATMCEQDNMCDLLLSCNCYGNQAACDDAADMTADDDDYNDDDYNDDDGYSYDDNYGYDDQVPQCLATCLGGGDDSSDACGDDDEGIWTDTDGALTCAAGFAMLGNQCDDDAAIVALGALAGWFASKCPATCGLPCADDGDESPPCVVENACFDAMAPGGPGQTGGDPTCGWMAALVECGGEELCADDAESASMVAMMHDIMCGDVGATCAHIESGIRVGITTFCYDGAASVGISASVFEMMAGWAPPQGDTSGETVAAFTDAKRNYMYTFCITSPLVDMLGGVISAIGETDKESAVLALGLAPGASDEEIIWAYAQAARCECSDGTNIYNDDFSISEEFTNCCLTAGGAGPAVSFVGLGCDEGGARRLKARLGWSAPRLEWKKAPRLELKKAPRLSWRKNRRRMNHDGPSYSDGSYEQNMLPCDMSQEVTTCAMENCGNYDEAVNEWLDINFAECDLGNCLDVFMEDSFGDGWNGGQLTIVDYSGGAVFTGTLESGSSSVGEVCLECGQCYTGQATGSAYTSEVSWNLAGVSVVEEGSVSWCVKCGEGDGGGGFELNFVTSWDTFEKCLAVNMMDSYGDGWNGGQLAIWDDWGNAVFMGALESGFSSVGEVCLACGQCYSAQASGSSYSDEMYWFVGDMEAPVMDAAADDVAWWCANPCPPPGIKSCFEQCDGWTGYGWDTGSMFDSDTCVSVTATLECLIGCKQAFFGDGTEVVYDSEYYEFQHHLQDREDAHKCACDYVDCIDGDEWTPHVIGNKVPVQDFECDVHALNSMFLWGGYCHAQYDGYGMGNSTFDYSMNYDDDDDDDDDWDDDDNNYYSMNYRRTLGKKMNFMQRAAEGRGVRRRTQGKKKNFIQRAAEGRGLEDGSYNYNYVCEDLNTASWPAEAAPLIGMGGCAMVPMAASMGITCYDDISANPTVQGIAPGVTGTLGDLCPDTCGMCGGGSDNGGGDDYYGGGTDGEAACEGHSFTQSQCAAVGCCDWDQGECWSTVGKGDCEAGGDDYYDGPEDDDYYGGPVDDDYYGGPVNDDYYGGPVVDDYSVGPVVDDYYGGPPMCTSACFEALQKLGSVCKMGDAIPEFSSNKPFVYNPIKLNKDDHLESIGCGNLFPEPPAAVVKMETAISLPPMDVPSAEDAPVAFRLFVTIVEDTLKAAARADDLAVTEINGVKVGGKEKRKLLAGGVDVKFEVTVKAAVEGGGKGEEAAEANALASLATSLQALEEAIVSGSFEEVLAETAVAVMEEEFGGDSDAWPEAMAEMSEAMAEVEMPKDAFVALSMQEIQEAVVVEVVEAYVPPATPEALAEANDVGAVEEVVVEEDVVEEDVVEEQKPDMQPPVGDDTYEEDGYGDGTDFTLGASASKNAVGAALMMSLAAVLVMH